MSDEEKFGAPGANSVYSRGGGGYSQIDDGYNESDYGADKPFNPANVVVYDDYQEGYDGTSDAYGEPPEDEDYGEAPPKQKAKRGFSLSMGSKVALGALGLLVVACVAFAIVNGLHKSAVAKNKAASNSGAAVTESPQSTAQADQSDSSSQTWSQNPPISTERWREIADIGSYAFEQTMEQVFTVKGTRRYALTGRAEPQIRLVAYGSLAAFDGEYEIEVPSNTLDKMVKGFQFTVKVDVYARDGKYIVENPRAR